jgi:serine/threonine protein kinase
MTDDERLEELLDRWHEHWERGGDIPATDLCHGQPELAARLDARLEALRRVGRIFQRTAGASGESTPPPVSHGDTDAPEACAGLPPVAGADVPAPAPTLQWNPDRVDPGEPHPPIGDDAPATARRRIGVYELQEQLGEGGMGTVYKAWHVHLKKAVALKLLAAKIAHLPGTRERFRREVEAAGRLEHANLVRATDAGEYEGRPYLVMELLDGADLARLTKSRGRWPVGEACETARQVALGLEHVRECGLVHRDVKPSNLMRTADGTVKVLDLGLARLRTGPEDAGLTAQGVTMGTADYMAPEQLDGAAAVDIRADLYALGGSLFFLLTGRAPFAHRQGQFAKLEAARHETPADVRSLRPEVPQALAELVARLLAKDPADRPQTPAEVAAAVEAFAADGNATLATTSTWTNPSRRRGRHRGWVVVGLGLAILASVGWWLSPAPGLRPAPAEPNQGKTAEARDSGDGQPGPADGLPGAVGPDSRPAPADPLRVASLDVVHIANVRGKGLTRGVVGKQSFSTRWGDAVTVEAKLTRPAYAYMIAFRPDGKDDLCFPESVDETPPRTDHPRFPSASQQLEYRLDDGAGLEVFAVVASDRPLPPYKEWRARREAPPWKSEKSPDGMVWWYDGTTVEPLAEGAISRSRKEGEGRAAVVRLVDWLRGEADGRAAAAVGFVVLPKGNE